MAPPESNRIIFPMAIADSVEIAYAADQRRNLIPFVAQTMLVYENLYRRFDAVPSEFLQLLADLNRAEADSTRVTQIEDVARRSGEVYDHNNRIQVGTQIEKVLGINLGGVGPLARRTLDTFVTRNVSFIRRLDRTTRSQIRDIIEEAFIKRTTPETLQSLLVERVGVAESRAKLIARDQGNKFFGGLTEARHRDAGAREYVWITSLDERVRSTHRALHGNRYSYQVPPIEGNPGQPIQCRCTSVPVFT